MVAYVYGNLAITREEFASYLIELFGRDRVRDYVNRRVMEIVAAQKKITVTPQEVDAVIDPAETRQIIGESLRLLVDKRERLQARPHDNTPL